MQKFHFEHVYLAPSTQAVFDCYFDAEQAIAQDKEVGIIERTLIEQTDNDGVLARVCRVKPKRQLPGFVRPFVSGELYYTESLRWFRSEARMALEIRPSLLSGRALISVDYRLYDDGATQPGSAVHKIRRVYKGEVTIDVALVGGKIEKGIVGDMEASLAVTAKSTQAWISQHRAV